MTGPEATVVTAVCAMTTILGLAHIPAHDLLELLAATAATSILLIAALSGRVPARRILSRLGKLADDQEDQ